MRKHAFCIFENKGAYQLCGNRAADQSICVHYIDSAIPLTIYISSVAVQPRTWSETLKTGFLTMWLNSCRF